MRFVVRAVFLVVALLLISPFMVSSLLVDQRGIVIGGRVATKDERIHAQYPSWTRQLGLMVQYSLPSGHGVSYMNAQVSPDRFDSLKPGDTVQLHYLLEKDLPAFPGWKTMWQMRILPIVRLAEQSTWSGPQLLTSAHRGIVISIVTAALVLLVWRLLGIPHVTWAAIACFVVAAAASLFAEMPRALPPPTHDLRTVQGTIQSLDRWEWLFQDTHHQGLQADQPILIAGVRFVPEGRTEPVVAVDLIDEGSIPGLSEHMPVTVEYEGSSPRVAYIRGATRQFFAKNLKGITIQGFIALAVVTILLTIGYLFTSAFGRPGRRRTGSVP